MSIELSGYLTKKGRNYKTWKRRWFTLSGSTLTYFVSDKTKVEKGCLDLTAGSIIPKTELFASKKFAFEISTPSRTLLVAADDQELMGTWVSKMQLAAIQASDALFAQHDDTETQCFICDTEPNEKETNDTLERDSNAALVEDTTDELAARAEEVKAKELEDLKIAEEVKAKEMEDLKIAEATKAKEMEEQKIAEAKQKVVEENRIAAEKLTAENEARQLKEMEDAKEAEKVAKEQAEEEKRKKKEIADAKAAEEERKRIEAVKAKQLQLKLQLIQDELAEQACIGFVCMKKKIDEIKYRTPRYVWCEHHTISRGAVGIICWSKGIGKSKTYKSVSIDRIRSITAMNKGDKASGQVKEGRPTTKENTKKKRGSVFAGLLDSSDLIDMITEDAVLTITCMGKEKSMDLHLEPSKSKSRVEGAVALRRNKIIEMLQAFVNSVKQKQKVGKVSVSETKK